MSTVLEFIAEKYPGTFAFAHHTAARILRKFPYAPAKQGTGDPSDDPEWLVVQPSLIPEAGNGLFTTQFCAQDTVLCEYKGTRLTALQLLRTTDWTYVYNYQFQFWIDARNHPRVKARFVNDHEDPKKHNVRWVERDERVFLEASRDLLPGEELYVEYGADYWSNHDYWAAQSPHLTDDTLQDYVARAMGSEQDVRIVRRSRIRSFHHHLERVRIAPVAEVGLPRHVELFVRVYGGQLSWSDVTRRDLPEREWAAWQVARRAELPLPETYWRGWHNGTALAIQQSVPGKTLWRAGTPAMIQQCAELMAKMHAAEVQDQERVHLADARVSPLLERLSEWAKETGDDLSIRSVRLLQEQAKDVQERPAAFLHGDCHPANFLADGSQFTAVIDWEEASLGDPRLDLATMDTYLRWLGCYFWWFQPGKVNRLADLFLQSYQETAGWELGPLTFWKRLIDVRTIVVAAWIGHRVRMGLPFPATNPGAWSDLGRYVRKRVQGWVDSP